MDEKAAFPEDSENLGDSHATLVPGRQQYVVSADGQRFLMDTIVTQAVSPITVILNWHPKP